MRAGLWAGDGGPLEATVPARMVTSRGSGPGGPNSTSADAEAGSTANQMPPDPATSADAPAVSADDARRASTGGHVVPAG